MDKLYSYEGMSNSNDNSERDLMVDYDTARDNVLNGSVGVTQVEACECAGIQIYIEKGNYNEEKVKELSLEKYLPTSIDETSDEIKEKVLCEYRRHTSVSESDAKKLYLDTCNRLSPQTSSRGGRAEAARKLMANKRVVVYVWTSEFLTGEGKAGHVAVEVTRDNRPGTQKDKTYISFWPYLKGGPIHNEQRLFTSDDNKKWTLIENYIGDRILEERKPEYIFCFYTLDVSKIVNNFGDFINNSEKEWHFYGQYFPKKSGQSGDYADEAKKAKPQSCVSLACLTLDAGGINKLLTIADVFRASATQQSEASQRNSSETYNHSEVIQPVSNNSNVIGRGLVAICGLIISPDVLVGRLKEAKIKEWNTNESVQKMERTVFTTKVNVKDMTDPSISVSFSHQDPKEKLNESYTDQKDNIFYEMSYEWLPMDEKFHFHFSIVRPIFYFILLVAFLYLYTKIYTSYL